MTIRELKDTLEDYVADGHGDLEVKVAEQPNYPLEANVAAVCRLGDTLWIAAEDAGGYVSKAPWSGEDDDRNEDEIENWD